MSQTVRAPLNPFRVLAVHRNFRIFWGGQTLSLVGTWMQSVAQGWLALELTDDPLMVGVVSAAGSLPVLFLTLYAGVLADRTDRLRLVTITQSLYLLQAASLWWFVASGQITIGGQHTEKASPRQVSDLGVAHIPEDRGRDGLINEMK